MAAACVATASTAVKAAALVPNDGTAAMIELRMMTAAAPMVFPRVVGIEVGMIAVAPPTVRVWRVAIPGVTGVPIVWSASARGAGDYAKQNQRCERAARDAVSLLPAHSGSSPGRLAVVMIKGQTGGLGRWNIQAGSQMAVRTVETESGLTGVPQRHGRAFLPVLIV
jgi:hypothetical protein